VDSNKLADHTEYGRMSIQAIKFLTNAVCEANLGPTVIGWGSNLRIQARTQYLPFGHHHIP
jgi:hypothetical protein